MRTLNFLLAAALCAGAAFLAGPAKAQEVLVAIHTDDAIHFVSQDALDELGRIGTTGIMPTPVPRPWPAVLEYLLEPDEDWRVPLVNDFRRGRERMPSACSDSAPGYLCVGIVRNYRLSRDSHRHQTGDPVELLPTRTFGAALHLPFA